MSLCKEIAQGMSFLHRWIYFVVYVRSEFVRNRVIHRDLKPANVYCILSTF